MVNPHIFFLYGHPLVAVDIHQDTLRGVTWYHSYYEILYIHHTTKRGSNKQRDITTYIVTLKNVLENCRVTKIISKKTGEINWYIKKIDLKMEEIPFSGIHLDNGLPIQFNWQNQTYIVNTILFSRIVKKGRNQQFDLYYVETNSGEYLTLINEIKTRIAIGQPSIHWHVSKSLKWE